MNMAMDENLSYEKHAKEGHNTGNSRNDYSFQTLKWNFGEMEIATPRGRNGNFEPQLIKKGQTRVTEFDQQILALYAKGGIVSTSLRSGCFE
jgi:putative transposase